MVQIMCCNNVAFLLLSEVEFFGKCSVRHMFKYFHLCIFLMNVSSYAWAQVIMLNQTLWICWKQKAPWNFGTDNLNYTGEGKEKKVKTTKTETPVRARKGKLIESWKVRVYLKSVRSLKKKAFDRRKIKEVGGKRNAGINGPKLCISWERLKRAFFLSFLPSSSSRFLCIYIWKEILVHVSKIDLWHWFQLKLLGSACLPRKKKARVLQPKCRWLGWLFPPKDTFLGSSCHSRRALVSCKSCQLHVCGSSTLGQLRGLQDCDKATELHSKFTPHVFIWNIGAIDIHTVSMNGQKLYVTNNHAFVLKSHQQENVQLKCYFFYHGYIVKFCRSTYTGLFSII